MRIDFREERKWKLALAYHLSTAVLEWHALRTWDERVSHGVCVKWKPIPLTDTSNEELQETDLEPASDDGAKAGIPEPNSLLGVDYGSESEASQSFAYVLA